MPLIAFLAIKPRTKYNTTKRTRKVTLSISQYFRYVPYISFVKPQFEVEKGSVEKGGIVRDIKQYQKVIHDLILAARKHSGKP